MRRWTYILFLLFSALACTHPVEEDQAWDDSALEGKQVLVTFTVPDVRMTSATKALGENTDLQDMYLAVCGNSGYLSPASVEEMKKKHPSYGALSPTLSYGLGLLQINDSHISGYRVLGHQGFAYGCGDGAFWEEGTGNILIFLNGGCSEARTGRLGSANRDFTSWAFRKELPSW